MNKNKILILIGIITFALILNFPINFSNADETINKIYSYKTYSDPIIDGTFDNLSEWSDAYHTSFYHSNPSSEHRPGWVHIYTKHTNEKLYILIDDIPDNTSENDDGIFINFDCNYDNIDDENISMNILKDYSTPNIGNSLADWQIRFDGSANNNTDHTIMEIAINITTNSAYDGSSKPVDINYSLPIGTSNNSIKFELTAPVFACNWSLPQDSVWQDPSTYANLVFTKKPGDSKDIPFSNFSTITLITSITIIGVIIMIIKRREL